MFSLAYPHSPILKHCLSALSPSQPPISLSSGQPLFRVRSLSSSTTSTIATSSSSSSSTSKMDPISSISTEMPLSNGHHLRIAIIGFGKFGQFLAKTIVSQGHTVLAHSCSDHSLAAKSLGASFFQDPNDLCEQHPEVVLLCTSIISTEQVLKSLPLQRLKQNTLFVDVLSVKEFAKQLLLDVLPPDFDIICSHPMFGPQSSKLGWDKFHFVYEKVRVGSEESRVDRCKNLLDIFARNGCKMVEMNSKEHHKHVAESQFITHIFARLLEMLQLKSTPINTKGYESLLDLVENTAGDSFDLYYGLFVYNKNALEMLEKLDLAFEALKKQLFQKLNENARKQLFWKGERGQALQWSYVNEHYNFATLASDSTAVRVQVTTRPYQYKGQISACIDDNSKLKIAIVGFGNFGQFLAKTFMRQGHTILAYSRTDYSDVAQKLGVSYFSNADDLCEEHPEVMLLCTSILSTENVLKSLPVQRLKRSTLFVDVLSVKEFPRNLFLQHLPSGFDILCAHPMFGPESGKNGWSHLPFVFDKVRVGSNGASVSRCDKFLDIFAREGCRMVEMSCAEHDWHAAGSQFITHTVGRALEKLGLESTPINIKGYETLLNLVENTARDSFDLYYGLFLYNANAMEQLERLDLAFEALKKQLLGQLHGVIRKELFESSDESKALGEEFLVSPSKGPQKTILH